MDPYQLLRTLIFLGVVLLYMNQTICSPVTVLPLGTFVTACHDRNFWVSIKSSFLGHKSRFDIEDGTGIHFLSNQRAAECGYTILFDHHGNLVFRASYLACHVVNKADSEFSLQVWFVNQQAGGQLKAYPLHLHCLLPQPWSQRDIMCEKNYMEVSIKPQTPAPQNNTKNWMDVPPMKEQLKQKGRVMFYLPGGARNQPRAVREALALGYVINATDTRVVLRCAWSSPYSHTLSDKGVMVEAVNAFVLIQRQGHLTTLDLSVACVLNGAVVEGDHLVWSSPLSLSPLVHGLVRDSSVRLGVAGEAMTDCTVRERGYEVTSNDRVLQVRIPFGAEGTHTQIDGVNGQLSKVISLDLFFMHEWEDSLWSRTQHRTFRFLHSHSLPHTPRLINDTVCSKKAFFITVGPFPQEMSFKRLTIGGQCVSWLQAQKQALHISQVHLKNGSFIYQLRVPFSHPTIAQKRIRSGYMRTSLDFILTLNLTSNAEEFDYSATVVCDEKLADTGPWLEGSCRESSVEIQLYYSPGERPWEQPWELRVGGRKLDWELMELGNYQLDLEEDYLSVELPLFAPGMTFENLTLKSVDVKVEVSVVVLDSIHLQHHLTQHCSFPVRDLLACLPEGRMLVVVDTSRTLPPTPPKSTTLLDPTCGPTQTDSTRALFNFTLNSCGTTQSIYGDYVMYENQVLYSHDLQPSEEPIIHRHFPYRLTIQCLFPANITDTVSFWRPI